MTRNEESVTRQLLEDGVMVSQRPHVPTAADVIVCGGGPGGLSMSYLLGRAGVRVALFEQRPSTTTLPKGQFVHASTGELLRQWKVWDMLDNAGWETLKANGQGFYVTVAGGPICIAKVAKTSHQDYVREWAELSPVYPRRIPASAYESSIRHRAVQWPTAVLRFNSRVVSVEMAEDHVEVAAVDMESGAASTINARYLVACDGAHSLVRGALGRGQDQGPTFGRQILVEFRADLGDNLGHDGFFHSFIIHPLYAGWFGSKDPESGVWRYSFTHDEDELPTEAMILNRIRGALGMPTIPLQIVQFYRFDYTTGLLRSWREGRTLFVGDAAHWHSPWGGYGMNSSIQDANNLGWKLALVVHGLADDSLLDTYAIERKSKALITAKAATYNSLNYKAIVEASRIGEAVNMQKGLFSDEGKRFFSQMIAPHISNSVIHPGYQFGTVYHSSAICGNGDSAPTPKLHEYVETTIPGVRAPHAWLVREGSTQMSTIDLWPGKFVLVGANIADWWTAVCKNLSKNIGVEVALVNVTAHGELIAANAKFNRLYGARENEATLVRPDGFVCAKFYSSTEDDGARDLDNAMACILGKRPGGPRSKRTMMAHEQPDAKTELNYGV